MAALFVLNISLPMSLIYDYTVFLFCRKNCSKNWSCHKQKQ